MNRDEGLRSHVICFFMMALPLFAVGSNLWAAPVQFVPITSMVAGPPYPTGALAADIVVNESGTPVIIDRFSSSIGRLNPIGAVDWFVADSFSFGVERAMEESGEKGGTADINIGVGELQECTISKSMDASSTKLAQFAINGNSMSVMLEFQSSLGTVAFNSEYTTPQDAVFTGVSIVPSSDNRSFDLNFSLLYNARYDAGLPILTEVMTANFVAIPEPASALLLMTACAIVCLQARVRPQGQDRGL